MEEEKVRLDQLPDDDASLDEWKIWGSRIIERYREIKKSDQTRVNRIRKLRKEIDRKNKVFRVYKNRVSELEDRINSEGSPPHHPNKFVRLIQSLFNKRKK